VCIATESVPDLCDNAIGSVLLTGRRVVLTEAKRIGRAVAIAYAVEGARRVDAPTHKTRTPRVARSFRTPAKCYGTHA